MVKRWRDDAGDYEFEVGASSRDIRQKEVVHLEKTFDLPVPESRDFTTSP